MTICRDVLQRHQWNLEVAVQEQLNIREGRPSVYASESRPPAVVNDLLGQLVYFTPPTDGSGSGFKRYFRAIVGLVWNVCYSTLITILQITKRLLGKLLFTIYSCMKKRYSYIFFICSFTCASYCIY